MCTDFPSTRYQGSKRRILEWVEGHLKGIEFDTALDVFGGTGSVSYLLKTMGKEVTFNDILLCNTTAARALVRNNSIRLSEKWLNKVKFAEPYDGLVSRVYNNVFFTEEENKEIDKIAHCIFSNPKTRLEGARRDLALYALSQALLMKRPFNLFHRANLDIRLKDCERRFGNKTTWEKPILDLMQRNLKEANDAIFSNGKRHHVLRKDALSIGSGFDLLYVDPPYCSKGGICADYHNYYSFLDGMCDYTNWEERIDCSKKNLPLVKEKTSFMNSTFETDLKKLFSKHSESIIVMSYKSPGKPTTKELANMLKETHKDPMQQCLEFSYALNRNNGNCRENLFIALPKK